MPEEQEKTSTQEGAIATAEAPAQETGASDSPAAESASPKAETATDDDWARLVESVDPEQLRRHPRVAGIVGDMVDKAFKRWKSEQEETVSRQKAEEAEAALQRLAQDDPVAFSERFLTESQQKKVQRDLAELRQKTAGEFAKSIGAAMSELEEWKDLSREDMVEIAAALSGKTDDADVLSTYTKASVRKLISKALPKAVEAELAKRLEKERTAWRQEWEAERLASESAPDMSKPRGAPGKFDPSKLKGKAFDDWYEKNVLNR